MIDAVIWLENDYTEDGLWYKQTGIQDNLPQATVADTVWYTSKMTELIGFPLQMASPSPISNTGNRNLQDIGWNQLMNYLHLRIDTQDPSLFGLPDPSFDGTAWTGSARVTRQDLGPLHVKHIEILNEFTRKIKEVMCFQQNKHTFEDPRFNIAQTQYCFTPNIFAQFCVKYRKEKMEAGEQGWENVECPVIKVCGSCMAARRPDARQLLVCSRCKYRQYCSKECQKRDWKRHTTTCPGAEKKAEDSVTT